MIKDYTILIVILSVISKVINKNLFVFSHTCKTAVFGLLLLLCPHSKGETFYLMENGGVKRQFSFQASKLEMFRMYKTGAVSFYCGCTMELPYILTKGCSLRQDISLPGKAYKAEYEHVFAVSNIKKRMGKGNLGPVLLEGCSKKSRSCLRSSNELFKTIEGDLHNIRPVISIINRMRGSLKIGEVKKNVRKSGCGFKVGEKYFEPPNSVKGDVARIMLYLDRKYDSLSLLSKSRKDLFKKWNESDPVSRFEQALNNKIKEIQGDSNFYIEYKKGNYD